ncbi:hypothetical protein [Janibacter anophelis]|uniref:hypothetical protein n=1 Tax=Janibacter anophelis TaxID=319054 RepID=UPI0008319EE4|nr:hypothetical protein [Janibacter anophelis]
MRHTTQRLLMSAGTAAGFMAISAGAALAAPAPGPNQPEYWEAYFAQEENGGYVDVECDKRDSEGPYTVDGNYIAIIIKAGAGDDQNQVIMNPEQGETYETHENGKDISHVIYCTGEEPTEPSETTEPTEPSETTSTSTSTTPVATTTPGGPQTPGVVQTDGGPLGGDTGAMLTALGIAGLVGTAGAAAVVRTRGAARRH